MGGLLAGMAQPLRIANQSGGADLPLTNATSDCFSRVRIRFFQPLSLSSFTNMTMYSEKNFAINAWGCGRFSWGLLLDCSSRLSSLFGRRQGEWGDVYGLD